MYVNKNAGNPNAWTYDPDLSQQAFTDIVNKTHIARLTWQATPRNKFSVFWSEQYTGTQRARGRHGDVDHRSARQQNRYIPSRVQQATWSSPVTSRLLLEAGYGSYNSRWGNGWQTGGRMTAPTTPR